ALATTSTAATALSETVASAMKRRTPPHNRQSLPRAVFLPSMPAWCQRAAPGARHRQGPPPRGRRRHPWSSQPHWATAASRVESLSPPLFRPPERQCPEHEHLHVATR